MDAARKFVDKGQIDKAVKEYLRIVSEDPKDVRVWLKIGDLYAKKGAKQDAIETYLKVARFYAEQGFFLKAVAVYKQILKLDPRLVDVILKLAELYRQLGQMSEAMQHFESVAAHFHREGNTKEALVTVKKLVDLDPENIATRIKLAELYSKESLVEDAITEFTLACDQLRRQNRQDDFVKVAERLLWHKPDNHALNRELAGLYLRRNDPRRALQKLQTCFKADPRDVETLGLLAQAFQALEQKSKTVSVLKELARVHIENKQRDRAVEVYRKIIEFVPTDPDARDFLGTHKAAEAAAASPPTTNPQQSQPLPPTRPPVPPPRASTPIPAVVTQANAKFSLTGDLPSFGREGGPKAPNLTGSMPLVDEQSLSGVDFALPEYDDADFSADMEPAPDPRAMSAAGERHAEEISKILAETDVYVKYGLHQKAVDHLRRVFSLDTDNVEAHERLKDIFVGQGREQEAEVELLKLAEVVAPGDPDRAEAYLQELLAMNGTHTGAFDLARRFRLRVARMSSASAEVEYGGGSLQALDGDLDELSLDDAPRAAPQRAMGVARSISPVRDSIDDFDPGELINSGMAHGSPAPGRPPQRPDDFAADFDLPDDEPVVTDRPPSQWSEPATSVPETADEDLPFDPDEARAFDAHVPHHASETTAMTGALQFEDPLAVSGGYDPYSTESASTPSDPTMSHAVDTTSHGYQAPEHVERAESLVEDDLEEADFYAGQGMYAEAMDVLNGLLERYPSHPLLLAKIREVDGMMNGGEVPADSIEGDVPEAAAGGTDAIDLDEIEEINDFDEAPESVLATPKKKRGPTVMLEKPIEDGDAETHYDLGLAYKEMGLHDEAIKEFEKAAGSPGREVSCRLMIGLILRDQGNLSESIQQLKQGLHAEPSDRERQSLYYEIGVTYESLGDASEAKYYLEMVVKRDPSFADAAQRLTALRDGAGMSLDDDI
ncbi:MAG TPA: tetratricopeptide repeat protein [Kofleriaceae bacterium]